MNRYLLPLFVLVGLAAPVHAQSTVISEDSAAEPDGIVHFQFDAWGGLGNGLTFSPRDPVTKATTPPPGFLAISSEGLSIIWRDDDLTGPDESERVLLSENAHGSITFDAPDQIRTIPALYNPATDLYDPGSKTRTSEFGLAQTGVLSNIRVSLVQQIVGQALVQTYTFTNSSGADIEIYTVPVSDTDIDVNAGWGANRSSNLPGWLGAGTSGQSITALDDTLQVGHTIAIAGQTGTFDGWRGMRTPGAVGWEIGRAPYFFGYPLTSLNSFFSYPGGNGTTLEFTQDQPDDLAPPGDGYNDAGGDVAISLQYRQVVPANGSTTVTVTHTFFANGPWIFECPSADLFPADPLDAPVDHYTGFGARTLSASGLPSGFAIGAGDRLQGVASDSGTFDYTLITTDELGRSDTVDCQINVACVATEETCDGVDNDCNGTPDDNINAVELCNNFDDDCNGLVDDNIAADASCGSCAITTIPSSCEGGQTIPCQANQFTLGALGDAALSLNLLTCGDYNGAVDVDGAVAIGGTLDIPGGFSIGFKAPLGDPDAHELNPEVGETMTIAYANAINFQSGASGQFYGNIVTVQPVAIPTGVTLLEGGAASTGDPLGLTAKCDDMQLRSQFICNADGGSNSAAPIPLEKWWGEYHISAYQAGTNLFEIDAQSLSGSTTIIIDNPSGFDADVVVNVVSASGTDDVVLEMGEVRLSDITAESVLFNFCGVANLDMTIYGFKGSILAPLTAVTFSNGQIDGSLGVASLQGSAELHLAPFTAAMTLVSSVCPTLTASCSDGFRNQGEDAVDCGGPCPACVVAPTCNDDLHNQDETLTDCGGVCPACPPTCIDTEPLTPEEFATIPHGTFDMGSPLTESSRGPDEQQHAVRLTHPFWIQKTEVTYAQWEEVVLGYGLQTYPLDNGGWWMNPRDPAEPMRFASRYAAQAYMNLLSDREQLDRCYEPCAPQYATGSFAGGSLNCQATFPIAGCGGYRLPTEAEWEYAARAGTTTPTYATSGQSVDDIAWWRILSLVPQPVGGKGANAFGLHDMLGNVWEWVSDEYGPYPDPIPGQPLVDPLRTGPGTSVIRGGMWASVERFARSAARYGVDASAHFGTVGFRPARTILCAPTCGDLEQNQGEAGVDCGGPCTPCGEVPTCSDQEQNQDETDVDCGGTCGDCASCSDLTQNQDETGTDCGGEICEPCAAGGPTLSDLYPAYTVDVGCASQVEPTRICIASGAYDLGCQSSDAGQPGYAADCTGTNRGLEYGSVAVDAFCIDKYPVTAAEYVAWSNDNLLTLPASGTTRELQYNCDHPATHIDWFQAEAYCAGHAARLCTETEWEAAARGTDSRTYPWGNVDPTGCNEVNWFFCQPGNPGWPGGFGPSTSVDAFPGGASQLGIFDMEGNVFQWTSTPDPLIAERRVLRGGYMNASEILYLRSWRRYGGYESTVSGFYGFRCCETDSP